MLIRLLRRVLERAANDAAWMNLQAHFRQAERSAQADHGRVRDVRRARSAAVHAALRGGL